MPATSAVPATAETAAATKTAAAEAAKAMATAGAAAKAPGTAESPRAAKSAGAAPKSVVGAGVGARRSERRALHRRSTKVRATRALGRSGGTWHGRHSRCLRRRVCRSRRGVRGRHVHRQVRRWELAWRLGRSDLNRLLRHRHVHGG
jgi:hypothetical protein